jgi:hypothetical protein
MRRDNFCRTVVGIDMLLGEPVAALWFLKWFDETPRDEMRGLLLREIQHSLAMRDQDRPVAKPSRTRRRANPGAVPPKANGGVFFAYALVLLVIRVRRGSTCALRCTESFI